jgi:putative methyltransferase (TIGR04325 family)
MWAKTRDHMKNFNIWEGVYPSFKEAPQQGKGFQDKRVLLAKSKEFQKKYRGRDPKKIYANFPCYRDSLLPVLMAMMGQGRCPLRILDFGGGWGGTYLRTKSAVQFPAKLRYVIVDLPEICQEAQKIFRGNKELRFTSKIPFNFKADIVHVGSALQYIEEWRETLEILSQKCERYFLFTDLIAGNIPTYVTLQEYYGSKMPVWFLNINEFLKKVKSLGFELVLRSDFDSNVFGKHVGLPQSNFDARYRLGNTCNLLFRKSL